MKAVRLHGYHQQPVVDDVPEPAITGPLDVIVKIGGAGVCRTDLHIIEGQWDAAMNPPLPYMLGHENAGWVHEVGSAVTNVAVGDTVILHPTPTCGLCRACRAGNDMHCENSSFPGLSHDGGMAEYLLTSARCCVKLDPQHPARGRGRAGRRGHHRLPRGPQGAPAAVPGHHLRGHRRGRARPHRHPVPGRADRRPGSSWWTATRTRSSWPSSSARDHTVVADGSQVAAVPGPDRRAGAEVVLDFVAEQGAENDGWAMTAPGRLVLRHRLRRRAAHPDARHHLAPSATSSATSSAPTTTWPS